MKSILLIGLGRFGRHMAMKLEELHHEVLAIDWNEERVNTSLKYVTHAQIGDSTNEDFIASLGVRDFDLCMVTIGDNFQASLETTDLLKEHGAKFVVARASQDVQAKFLLRNGADEVVFPEKQVASWAAVRFSSNIFDYIALNPDYSIYEINPPANWIGRTLRDLDIRNKFHVNILASKRNGKIQPLPDAAYQFKADETILVMGSNKHLDALVQK